MARLEATSRLRHEQILRVAGVDDRLCRNRQPQPARQLQVHGPEHARPQVAAAVCDLHAHAHGAGLGAHRRIEELHAPGDGASGQPGELDASCLADAHPRHVVLVDLRDEPDRRQIRDRKELAAGLHVAAGDRAAPDHGAVHRRADRHRPLRLAGARDLVDLLRRHAQQVEPLSRVVGHAAGQALVRVPGRGRAAHGRRGRRPAARGQELLLGAEHVGAVDRRQRLALGHAAPGLGDEQVLDPAGEARGDCRQPALVLGNDARGGQLAAQAAPHDRRGLDARELDAFGRKVDRRQTGGRRRLAPLAGAIVAAPDLEGDQGHATDRTFARSIPDDLRVHGAAIARLMLGLVCGGRAPARCRVTGPAIHVHDRSDGNRCHQGHQPPANHRGRRRARGRAAAFRAAHDASPGSMPAARW